MTINPSLQRPAPTRLIDVNKRNNNMDTKNQQATTQAVYDSYDLAGGSTNINFFEGVNARTFPQTNIQQNRLTKGKTMTVERMYLLIYTVASSQITAVRPLDASAFPQFQKAQVSLLLGGQQVLENFPISSFMGPFNYGAQFGTRSISPATGNAEIVYSQSVYSFPATPVIVEELEFIARVQLPNYTAPSSGTTYLSLVMEGFGTLPKVVGAV